MQRTVAADKEEMESAGGIVTEEEAVKLGQNRR